MKDIIEKMKKKGIKFDKGLTEEEFEKINNIYGFTFPKEIKEFLSIALPINKGFYNWRDFSDKNVNHIKDFQKTYIEDGFEFDIEKNNLLDDFRKKFPKCKNDEELKIEVLKYLHSSPRLIPFFKHRCFFDGLDNMPIISFWQPTDMIFYGDDLKDYIEVEFFDKNGTNEIPKEKINKMGIWSDLLS